MAINLSGNRLRFSSLVLAALLLFFQWSCLAAAFPCNRQFSFSDSAENRQKELCWKEKWTRLLRARSHIHPPYYTIFTSEAKKIVWYRVYKAASQTILDKLLSEIPDLTQERIAAIPLRNGYYFSFAFVKNPFARVVSHYFHKVVTKRSNEFKECFDKDFDFFVRFIGTIDVTQSNPHIKLQSLLIPLDQCEFIGRVENFDEDFRYVCDRLGIEMGELPHTHQTVHEHYSRYYTKKTREIVERLYKKDLETFGYQFEQK